MIKRTIVLFMTTLLLSTLTYAYLYYNDPFSFPPVNWKSANKSDVITIENGNGTAIAVQIVVDSTGSDVDIIHCGNTERIKKGSSALCLTNDAKQLISFHSIDDKQASGTYQVKRQ